MFEDYFLEEYGREVLVRPWGFAAYEINGQSDELFLSDFFIKKPYRRSYKAKFLFEDVKQLAKEKGLRWITGIVSVGVKNPDQVSRILRCYLAMGFQVHSATNNQIVIGMEIDR